MAVLTAIFVDGLPKIAARIAVRYPDSIS